MQVILFQPQIPQNTGNIVRTCAVTGSTLVLVRPLGFQVSSRQLRRAGLDYWEGVDVQQIDDLEAYIKESGRPFYCFSSKVSRPYTDIRYQPDDLLIFGSETAGLPSHYHEQWQDRFYTLPMREGARCLNLASSVGIVLYEGWRQLGFK